MERVALPRQLVQEMLDHASGSPQVEVCGLLAARAGRPSRCIPVTNIAREPQRFFNMDPKQQIEAMRSMRQRGEQLYGIYHSHPRGPAEPSATDIEQAAYPGALYLIVALNSAQAPQLRAYRISNGSTQPVQLLTDPAERPGS